MGATKKHPRAMDAQDTDDDLRSQDSPIASVEEWRLGELTEMIETSSQMAREFQGQLNRLRCIVRRLRSLRVVSEGQGQRNYITGEIES